MPWRTHALPSRLLSPTAATACSVTTGSKRMTTGVPTSRQLAPRRNQVIAKGSYLQAARPQVAVNAYGSLLYTLLGLPAVVAVTGLIINGVV